ncbi:MAG: hypothetical protein IK051_06375 [Rhodocyclaceae bacterium]|nr:hypothetical protein [Rhodocyclaceae bacterium]MBR4877257.1 hypothetical protein [Rhodocyclaceae bacterium]
MKRPYLLFFLAIAFFSFAGFYISAKFRPLPKRATPQAEVSSELREKIARKPRQHKTGKSKGSKKVRVAGCVVKGGECACYTRESRQLDVPTEVCERAIQSGQMPLVEVHEGDNSFSLRLPQ